MDLQLAGRRGLVTGASSGIGESIAKTLATEGVLVVVHGRDAGRTEAVVAAIRSAGGQAAPAFGDLATDDGAAAVGEAALSAFGGIDILVNNAGAPSDPKQGLGIFDLTPQHWIDTYERNLVSALRLSKQLSPAMIERGWGRIIQITSGLAYSPRGAQGDYTASKAAMNNFTFNLSRALKNTGVNVTGVCPGMTLTPVLETWLEQMAENAGLGRDRDRGEKFVLENVVELTVARLGLPQDIANAVAFLSSPKADYINGTTLRVDGGGSTSVT